MVRRKIHLFLSLRLFLVNLLALALGVSAIGIAYAYRSYKFSQNFSEIPQPKVREDGQHYHQEVIDLSHTVKVVLCESSGSEDNSSKVR